MFKLNLNNFRSFENQSFDLSRINILIGENSGGKSSLIKFILALKQSIENPQISNLILSGKHSDLGNFKEAIRNHNEDETIDFNFSFRGELEVFYRAFFDGDFEDEVENHLKPEIKDRIDKSFDYETFVNFSINRNLDDHTSIKASFFNEYLGSLGLVFSEKENNEKEYQDVISNTKTCTFFYKRNIDNKTYILEKIEYHKRGFLTIIDTPSLRRECEKIKNTSIFYECAVFLLNQNLIEYHLDNIKYLNPLNSVPRRIYINKDSQSEYEKADLEKFTNLVTTNQIPPESIKLFDKILKEYGIADGIKVNNSKLLPVSELRVKIKDLTSNISDVGYGVALQIPIIFEAFLAEQEGGANFIIEQPEVHLHPKLHAKFIETLLKLGDKNNYIIETHSEHIVRMLQVIVKNKSFEVSNSDIQIMYFTRQINKFEISYHPLDEEGKMLNQFPSGFYDTSYILTKKLLFK